MWSTSSISVIYCLLKILSALFLMFPLFRLVLFHLFWNTLDWIFLYEKWYINKVLLLLFLLHCIIHKTVFTTHYVQLKTKKHPQNNTRSIHYKTWRGCVPALLHMSKPPPTSLIGSVTHMSRCFAWKNNRGNRILVGGIKNADIIFLIS